MGCMSCTSMRHPTLLQRTAQDEAEASYFVVQCEQFKPCGKSLSLTFFVHTPTHLTEHHQALLDKALEVILVQTPVVPRHQPAQAVSNRVHNLDQWQHYNKSTHTLE